MVHDGLAVFCDDVDTKFDLVLGFELERLRLDTLGRQTLAIDESTV